VDVETEEGRPYVKSDAPLVAKIADALPNIDFIESSGQVAEFAGLFANTSKPIVARSRDRNGLAEIHKIALAEAGGQAAFERRPNYAYTIEPSSPLVGDSDALDKLVFVARHRIPLVYAPSLVAGKTAPMTAAGAIVQAAAESWLGLVLAQAIQPGLPFVMGGVLSIADAGLNLAYGAPELALMMAGLTELAHYAGLPVWQTGGGTDSKCLDEQAAIEGSLSAFFSALSTGDLCHAVGYTESGATGSVFQLVMMDDAIGYSRRITRGIEVNEDTLAVEVIHHVGPNGHYLREPQTRRLFKTEFWFPNLCDRRNFEEWNQMGRTTMRERAIARAQDILARHQPSPIKPATQKVIDKVLAKAEKPTRKTAKRTRKARAH
jgi:trimethylamine--corrinoid protein Co-methyltransferase